MPSPIFEFPDPETDDPDGIVGVGANLSVGTLMSAYQSGIFPWPIEGMPLPWFCPPRRALLKKSDLHISRSLAKWIKKTTLTVTVDQAFEQVIGYCARVPRPGQPGTWITPAMKKAYIALHQAGHAHSVEVWNEKKLVGGIYGVDPGGAFSAESMFHLETNASKLALLHLLDHLEDRGVGWLDIQMLTPHLKALGAKEISRNRFLALLKKALTEARRLF